MGEHATAVRPSWESLPEPVRQAADARLNARVVSAATQPGGFTHGIASRLLLDDGSRVFAKAIAVTDELAATYRAEAETSCRLPLSVPAPRLWFSFVENGWIMLVFNDIDGSHPRLNDAEHLADVEQAITVLARELTPNPIAGMPSIAESLGPELGQWRRWAATTPPPGLDGWSLRHLRELAELESGWEAATEGNTLLHNDIRPDNLLRRADGAVFVVDWAWPCTGAAWVDLANLMPSAAARGADPDSILASHPVSAAVDPAAISAFVAALAGYWTARARQPAPPRSPNLRASQARNADTAKKWLARRLRLA